MLSSPPSISPHASMKIAIAITCLSMNSQMTLQESPHERGAADRQQRQQRGQHRRTRPARADSATRESRRRPASLVRSAVTLVPKTMARVTALNCRKQSILACGVRVESGGKRAFQHHIAVPQEKSTADPSITANDLRANPSAPKKNEPLEARSALHELVASPILTQPLNLASADTPVACCEPFVGTRDPAETVCRSESVLMSSLSGRFFAALCTSAEICVTNSTDRASLTAAK